MSPVLVTYDHSVGDMIERMANPYGNTKHGRCGAPGYNVWQNMKQRCLNPNSDDFSYYGGRGIQICERWMNYANFYEDMGEPPKGMQLDRIDNDKGYEPSNCEWRTRKQNCRNRRSNMLLTYQGKTQTAQDWGEELGIKHATIRMRKYRGQSDAEALGANASQRSLSLTAYYASRQTPEP